MTLTVFFLSTEKKKEKFGSSKQYDTFLNGHYYGISWRDSYKLHHEGTGRKMNTWYCSIVFMYAERQPEFLFFVDLASLWEAGSFKLHWSVSPSLHPSSSPDGGGALDAE